MLNNGYAICPNEWIEDSKIKIELRLLLKISSLTAESGYCYASNEYLAEYFKTTTVTISKQISKLVDLDYLKIDYKRAGATITSRKIYLNDLSFLNSPLKKTLTAVKENFKDNNTSNNITSNNIESEISKNFTDDNINQKKSNKGNNYLNDVITAYRNAYKKEFNMQLLEVSSDKKAAGIIARHLKQIFPNHKTEQMIEVMEGVFTEIMKVNDNFLQKNNAKMIFVAENINNYLKLINKKQNKENYAEAINTIHDFYREGFN